MYHSTFGIPGHTAVVVFFVLSGYVIANATLNRPDMNAKRFIIMRLSRLHSVVVPALLLTAILLLVDRALFPETHYPFAPLRFIFTALFLQSIWSFDLSPTTNSPFWSLSYEFWYYVLFGILIFARSWKWKLALVVLCGLIAGANILLLLPIWAVGVGVYKLRGKLAIPAKWSVLGFLLAFGTLAGFVFILPECPYKIGQNQLLFSAAFLTDYLDGITIGAMILFFEQASAAIQFPLLAEKSLRWLANHSFSLYLFHFPLLLFIRALGLFKPFIWWQAALEVGLILAIIFTLSEFTESKRPLLQKWITQLWDKAAVQITGRPSIQPSV
jgi:peptidoglycan/LPS O-acetylase OafA/YrhL